MPFSHDGPSVNVRPRITSYNVCYTKLLRYRAYHAIRGLTAPDGRPTNAVYGFVTMLRKLIDDHHPDYIAASFDLPGPTFRDEIVDDYKANRAAMPDDLAEQIDSYNFV